MGKIQEGEIVCPALKEAYYSALSDALGSAPYPDNVELPGGTGNYLSSKGVLKGSGVCSRCSKDIKVELHLESIKGATRRDNGQSTKVFDRNNYSTSINTSGNKCTEVV